MAKMVGKNAIFSFMQKSWYSIRRMVAMKPGAIMITKFKMKRRKPSMAPSNVVATFEISVEIVSNDGKPEIKCAMYAKRKNAKYAKNGDPITNLQHLMMGIRLEWG